MNNGRAEAKRSQWFFLHLPLAGPFGLFLLPHLCLQLFSWTFFWSPSVFSRVLSPHFTLIMLGEWYSSLFVSSLEMWPLRKGAGTHISHCKSPIKDPGQSGVLVGISFLIPKDCRFHLQSGMHRRQPINAPRPQTKQNTINIFLGEDYKEESPNKVFSQIKSYLSWDRLCHSLSTQKKALLLLALNCNFSFLS